MKEINITLLIQKYIKRYTEMDINGILINCPYWANKIKESKVIARGFQDGKGEACDLQKELIRKILENRMVVSGSKDIIKLALRERIGIDCSGFVYRVLEKLVEKRYRDCTFSTHQEVFTAGITRTNSDTLTSSKYSYPIKTVTEIIPGDMIRISGGKHIAVIIQNSKDKIIYAHSSSKTAVFGVHLGVIKVLDDSKTLDKQEWTERTKYKEDYKKTSYDENKGDGVFRLKIFH